MMPSRSPTVDLFKASSPRISSEASAIRRSPARVSPEYVSCIVRLMAKPHILIAGAGIGGLTAALALLQRGYDVDVYEQAAELKGVGAGLQLRANATRP